MADSSGAGSSGLTEEQRVASQSDVVDGAVQDAAGAQTLRFCLDGRRHATAGLAHEGLSRFQGPSLLVYNDAQLEEAELRAIGLIPEGSSR